MEQIVVLLAVEISFPAPRVVIKLDKRVVVGGSIILFQELHYHEVPADQSMPDGLDNLSAYLDTNGWPDISVQDRAMLLNITNAARGADDQSAEGEA